MFGTNSSTLVLAAATIRLGIEFEDRMKSGFV
jgi:hypothetical protein